MTAVAFTIARERIASAVDRVAKVVQKRNTIEVLGHIFLQAEDGRLLLRGTDLDVEAAVEIGGAEITTPGAIAVPAAEFAQALSRWPDGELRIDCDGRRLTAKIARSRATLSVLPGADFPDIRANAAAHEFEIPGTDLLAMVDRCGFAIGQEDTRPMLMGIYLHTRGDRLSAVSTDGHRLSRFDMPLPEGAEGMAGVIVPSRTVRLWSNLLGKDEADEIKVETSADFIRFKSDAMTLHSKTIHGPYPDFERVIPRGNNQVAYVGLSDFANAVDRLRVFANGKGDGINVSFAAGTITMTTRADIGDAEEVVAAECDFELQIGFNGKYLREILSSLTGPRVRLALGDPSSPTLIGDDDDERRDIVLMPMRFVK